MLSQLMSVSNVSGQIKDILGTFNPRYIGVNERLLMRLDPDVSFGLAILRAPVVNLKWTVESEDPTIKAFIEGELTRNYRRMAKGASLAMIFGFQVLEKVWATKPVTLTIEGQDGAISNKTLPNAWVIERTKAIDPRTITLMIDNEKDDFGGVKQNNMQSGLNPPIISPKQLMLWSFRREEVWGRLTGFPACDQAYEPWWWKTSMNLVANRYFERRADPIVKGRAKASIQDVESGKTVDGYAYMANQLAGLKNGGNLVLPGIRDTQGNYIFDAEYMSDDKRGDMMQDRNDALGAQILRGLWVTDKAGTSDGTGSYNMAETHKDTMQMMIEAFLYEWVDEVLNPQFVDPLVLYNFGPEALESSKTKVQCGGISQGMQEIMKEVLGKVLDSAQLSADGKTGSLIDRIDGAAIAKSLGLPLISPEEFAETIAAKQAMAPFNSPDNPDGEEANDEDVADELVKKGALDPDNDDYEE